ncbi:hypothetical protein Tco_0734878 [Tanacetum coccineum]
MMNALEESRGIKLAWVIDEHLSKHGPGLKESSLICRGHYVIKIAKSLGYFMDDEIEKCSEPIECQKWKTNMLARELDLDEYKLLGSTELPMPLVNVPISGYDVRGSSRGFDDDDDAMKD